MIADYDFPQFNDDSADYFRMRAKARKENNKRYEYTFTWLIENYSYCMQKNKKVLRSPKTTWDEMDRFSWSILLYPRGIDDQHQGYISIYLQSWKDGDQIPLLIKFELSFLAADGSAVISRDFDFVFDNGDLFGCDDFLRISDLFMEHKDALLPQDILSVRCKLWFHGEDSEKFGQSVTRSLIRVKHLYFMLVVKAFSALKPKEKKTFYLYAGKMKFLKARLQLPDSSDGTLGFKITSSYDKKCLSTCSLFLMGESGVLTKCLEGDNRADATRKDISKLPLSLTKYEILAMKDEYLPDDKLTLLCHCAYSSGVKYEKIEKTFYNVPPSVLDKINYLVTEKPAVGIEVDDLIKF